MRFGTNVPNSGQCPECPELSRTGLLTETTEPGARSTRDIFCCKYTDINSWKQTRSARSTRAVVPPGGDNCHHAIRDNSGHCPECYRWKTCIIFQKGWSTPRETLFFLCIEVSACQQTTRRVPTALPLSCSPRVCAGTDSGHSGQCPESKRHLEKMKNRDFFSTLDPTSPKDWISHRRLFLQRIDQFST